MVKIKEDFFWIDQNQNQIVDENDNLFFINDSDTNTETHTMNVEEYLRGDKVDLEKFKLAGNEIYYHHSPLFSPRIYAYITEIKNNRKAMVDNSIYLVSEITKLVLGVANKYINTPESDWHFGIKQIVLLLDQLKQLPTDDFQKSQIIELIRQFNAAVPANEAVKEEIRASSEPVNHDVKHLVTLAYYGIFYPLFQNQNLNMALTELLKTLVPVGTHVDIDPNTQRILSSLDSMTIFLEKNQLKSLPSSQHLAYEARLQSTLAHLSPEGWHPPDVTGQGYEFWHSVATSQR